MKFYKTDKKHCCATVAVDGEYAIGDPCYLIPHTQEEPGCDPKLPTWREVCTLLNLACVGLPNWTPYMCKVRDVEFEIVNTDGDGFYSPGVAVDTGSLARAKLGELEATFGPLQLIPIE